LLHVQKQSGAAQSQLNTGRLPIAPQCHFFFMGQFGTGRNRKVVEVASTTYVDIIEEI